MKKILVFMLFGMFMFVCSPAFCANATVDVERILMEYNKAKEMNAQFERQNLQLKNYILSVQKQINDAKTPVEKKTLEDKYRAEFKTRTEKLKQEQLQQVANLEKEIYQAINKVSGNKYEMIFVKTMVIKGGTDITQEVITRLNSSVK